MRTTLLIIILILIMGCKNKNKESMIPSDIEMINYFNQNKNYFDNLYLMIEEDKLDHYPLFAQEKRNDISLPISEYRESEYKTLMEGLNLIRFYHPYKGHKIVYFIYATSGDATWGIDKGYEFYGEKMQEKEFINNELLDEALKKNVNTLLFKQINESWNLFLMYDR